MSHLDERNAAVMAGILLEEVRTNGTGVIVTSVGKRFEIEYDKVFSL
jgi:putative ABC transport system ATP-binding protein